MGVKSTVTLTRNAAEDLYVSLVTQQDHWRRKFRAEAAMMDDVTLENKLERINDEVNGGEGYDNYSIQK
jgi:hypothetical protein